MHPRVFCLKKVSLTDDGVIIFMQLYENEALKELLLTLDKELKYQLKELIKTYEIFEYKTPSEFLRFFES